MKPAVSAGSRAAARPRARLFLAVNLGNVLEWYDWSIFAIFAGYFADDFFGSGDRTANLLSTLAVFAAGFVMRPLGGVVLGRLADRRGRGCVLVLTMSLVAVCSILLAVSPTYRRVGLVAAGWLLVIRCVQGFAHGGELGGSYTYLAEVAHAARRGLWGSTIVMSTVAGTLLATLVGALLRLGVSAERMASWGWRVPFVLGGLLGLFALYLRRNLTEPGVFQRAYHPRRPARELWAQRGSLLRVVAIVAGTTLFNYTWSVSAPAYAIKFHGVPDAAALWVGVAANVVFLAALPLAGLLSDRLGRRFNLIAWGLGVAVLAVPLSALLGSSAASLLLAMCLALALQSLGASIQVAWFAELFSTRIRATGVGLAASVAAALFGGTAPYLNTWLTARGTPGVFTAYTIVLALACVVAALLTPETKGSELLPHLDGPRGGGPADAAAGI